MSGAIPADQVNTLPNDDPSAVIEATTVLQDDYFRRSTVPGTSTEAVERTHHVTQTSPEMSPEVLECAHHGHADSNVPFRNENDPPRETVSTNFNKGPSKVPLLATSPENISSSYASLGPENISSSYASLGHSLLASLFEPSHSLERERSGFRFSESSFAYKLNSIRLSRRHFPHLQSVISGSRHDEAHITIFDYIGSVLRDHRHLSMDLTAETQDLTCSKLDECGQFICSINTFTQAETRLVIVEDLGPSLINLLGATFDLSPEFFEEHLCQSSYRGFRVSETSPATWRTSNLQKNYMSFAWYRPGLSWALDLEAGLWEVLLDPENTDLETITQLNEKGGKSSDVIHNFRAKTNILREETELSTDPAGRVPEKVPCGRRERATVCSVEFGGVHYGTC